MAAEQNRPASPQQSPDPASAYDRSRPENEAGMGRMDPPKTTPDNAPDRSEQAVTNKQDPTRQINGQDTPNQRGGPAAEQPDHSMHEEEPNGWDQAPNDIRDPRQKRHPRTEGKGGTP
jgi:hypothetical protein